MILSFIDSGISQQYEFYCFTWRKVLSRHKISSSIFAVLDVNAEGGAREPGVGSTCQLRNINIRGSGGAAGGQVRDGALAGGLPHRAGHPRRRGRGRTGRGQLPRWRLPVWSVRGWGEAGARSVSWAAFRSHWTHAEVTQRVTLSKLEATRIF